MHLKRLISIFTCSAILLIAGDNTSLLSALKQEKLNIDKQKNELESDNLKYDWVKQIVGAYTYTDSGLAKSQTNLFSVSIDQPIFKSGGIYYGIQYSGANREFLRLTTRLSEQTLIKSVILSWLLMKRYDIQINRQNFLIENAKIDVMRKKEQYESGFLDSSFLDNSILVKSTLEKAHIDMESSRYSQLMEFSSLSDADYMKITPPTFVMVDKSAYLDKSLSIQQQIANTNKAEYLKKMTVANSLLTVSAFAGYYDKEVDIASTSIRDDYSTYGLKFSIPIIDVNRGRTIEIRQLDFLKTKIELDDVKKSEANMYADSMKKIELLNKKINIVKNDEKLYDSLLTSTKELFEAGEKTIYDVQTLENSKQTMKLDRQLFELDAQRVYLELYAKMSGEI